MRFLVLLAVTIVLGCANKAPKVKSTRVDWGQLDKMYYFSTLPTDFETNSENDIISRNEYKLFDPIKAKEQFRQSKYEGKTQPWKGGTVYAIARFVNGSYIKLELSSNYGVYNVLETDNHYEIKADSDLRRGRWTELLTTSN